MRIGVVTNAYHPDVGGVETHVRRLCAGLVAAGDEVEVLTQHLTAVAGDDRRRSGTPVPAHRPGRRLPVLARRCGAGCAPTPAGTTCCTPTATTPWPRCRPRSPTAPRWSSRRTTTAPGTAGCGPRCTRSTVRSAGGSWPGPAGSSASPGPSGTCWCGTSRRRRPGRGHPERHRPGAGRHAAEPCAGHAHPLRRPAGALQAGRPDHPGAACTSTTTTGSTWSAPARPGRVGAARPPARA